MANRNFNRKQALEKEIKDIYAKVTVGATGAPTLTSSVGIASIVRNSAGLYTVTLQDAYNSLKFAQVSFLDNDAQDIRAQIAAEDVDGAKTVQFVCLTAATPTDPQSGQTMLIKFELKNSSVA
jgi:hypothetical protein